MPEAVIEFHNLEVDAEFAVLPPSELKSGFANLMNAYNGSVSAPARLPWASPPALSNTPSATSQRARAIWSASGRVSGPAVDACRDGYGGSCLAADAARSAELDGNIFPDKTLAARAKLFASESAIKVVNDALQMFGARGYGDKEPLERMYRDVRMFTIGGGTAQVLKTQIASSLLEMKLPQTRDGYASQERPIHLAAAE